MEDLFAPRESTLTVLSFGGGQDSTALLELYLSDPEKKDWFWAKHKPDGSLHTNPKDMKRPGKVAKGMNVLMSIPHLIAWVPLEAALLMRVTGAAGADPVGNAEMFLAVILLVFNGISLGFDFLDSYKWLKGERDTPRPSGHKAS